MSSSGGGGGPLRLRCWEEEGVLEGLEAREVVDALVGLGRVLVDFRAGCSCSGGRDEGEGVNGRMSFFCLEAGRISSRSTGTPRETRKRRRMRDRTQFGG